MNCIDDFLKEWILLIIKQKLKSFYDIVIKKQNKPMIIIHINLTCLKYICKSCLTKIKCCNKSTNHR